MNAQLWPLDLQDLGEVGITAGTSFNIVCAESCSEDCTGPRVQDCVGLLESSGKTAIVGRKGRESDWTVLYIYANI